MNLVPGGELLGLINRSVREKEAVGSSDRGCDIATTRFYIAELIEALEYLHSRDIVHLDIKPESKFALRAPLQLILLYGLSRISVHGCC